MNLKYKISSWALAGLTALSLASCSESFLDREPAGSYVTDEQMNETMKWNVNVLLGDLQGITSNLIRWQSGGTSRQDDFGQKSVDIATDLMTGDMVYSRGNSYGWFGEDCQLLNATYTANRSYILWRYYYRAINSANVIIDLAGGTDAEVEDATDKMYFAIAKTIRANSYFNLVTLYGKNYDEAKDKKLLPVYDTRVEVYDAPQTVDSVYNFIIKDLNSAIANYEAAAAEGVVPTDISMPDISVAYTVLAYAQLQKGNNAAAANAANMALQNSNLEPLSGDDLYFGFNTVNNNDWMWGVDITAETTGGLCTFWGMMDYFTYSYAAAGDFKVINSDLFNEIPLTDARRIWFTAFGTAQTNLLPANKFYDNARVAMGDASWVNDIHFMRIEEPVLILAEAAAREGDLTTARQALAYLLSGRDATKAAAVETMSQDELLEEIYFNWRVEFWGEGKSLLTLKRFKKSSTRPANDYYRNLTQSGPISYDDARFTFAIPQSELQNNPLMSEVEQ